MLDPLLPALEGANRLFVAGDGAVHLLPLDGLPQGDGLVGHRWSVVRVESFAQLDSARPESSQAGDLLVAGGLDYGQGSAEFEPLPATLAEAEAVQRIHREVFGESNVEALVGPAATKERFAQSVRGARFVHLATHGYFASESIPTLESGSGPAGVGDDSWARGLAPMVLCGLALAGANEPPNELGERSGILTAEELGGYDLSGCELAVLSACDTNVGEHRAGQGVASLQAALHAAGARTTVTSLWKVPDEPTRRLMELFYRGMWIDGKSKARALWDAKMELRRSGAPPGDWASWVLTGGSGLMLAAMVLVAAIAQDVRAFELEGGAHRVEHRTGASGTLHVSAYSETFDPRLRIEREGELLAEDEDSGGGTAAYLALAVEPGQLLRIEVSCQTHGCAGAGSLKVFEAPETDETRVAAQAALEALEEVARLSESGEPARSAGPPEGGAGVARCSGRLDEHARRGGRLGDLLPRQRPGGPPHAGRGLDARPGLREACLPAGALPRDRSDEPSGDRSRARGRLRGGRGPAGGGGRDRARGRAR